MFQGLTKGAPAALLAVVLLLSGVKVASSGATQVGSSLSVSMDIFTYMGTLTNAEHAYNSFKSMSGAPHELWYGRDFTKARFLQNLGRFDMLYYNGWAAPGVIVDGLWPYSTSGDTYIFAQDISAAVTAPYKFVYLDTCATAEDDQLANAFGIYQGDQNRAMLGWAGVTYDNGDYALFTRTVFDDLVAGKTLQQAALEATSRSRITEQWRIVGDAGLVFLPGIATPTPTSIRTFPTIDFDMRAQGTLDGVTYASAAPGGQNIPIAGTGPISLSWRDTIEGKSYTFTLTGRIDTISPLSITLLTLSWTSSALADSVIFNQQQTFVAGTNEYMFGPFRSPLGIDYTVWGNLVVR